MFKKIALAVAVLLAAVLAYAATKPDSFHVERTATVSATPEQLLPLLSDFHRWEAWSPWEKLDPQMKRTFEGSQSGQGAVYAWTGNSEVGSGRMEVLSATPQAVTIKLDFITPMATSNTTAFALEPNGATTRVIWKMDGPMPYMSKLMTVFMSMDGLIGKDFEKGLAQLKAEAEKPQA